MNIISWIILGLIAGAIANAIDPNSSKGGILSTMILGIVGALVGGILSSFLFGIGISGFNLESLFIAIVGSLLLLFMGRNYGRI